LGVRLSLDPLLQDDLPLNDLPKDDSPFEAKV
jgi:hypothetical protein